MIKDQGLSGPPMDGVGEGKLLILYHYLAPQVLNCSLVVQRQANEPTRCLIRYR